MSQHVLIPVDRSPHSEKAFDYVVAELPGSRLLLLHVIDPLSAFRYDSDEYFDLDGYQQLERRQRELAEQMFTEYRETAAEHGFEVDTAIKIGKPVNQILETAADRGIDHIVMGSHGRSGVKRILLGSVAETVTRRSSVPVTIVR